jgi:hypothetical protein
MQGILWPVIGLLVCLGGLCIVAGAVSRFGRGTNLDDAPTGSGDADRTR